MSRYRAATIGAAVVALSLALPQAAFAHGGQANQVATDFLARVRSVPAGVAVKVVDGDQRLWMSVNPRLTVIVIGLEGEPYLRFSHAGVAENLQSPTMYLNRPVATLPPADQNLTSPPVWRPITSAHTYMWHEDRLHALALAARPPATNDIGRWVIPLTIDGHRTAISGHLWYAAPPSRLWFWPLVVVVACAAALIRIGDRRINVTLARALAIATLPTVVLGRLGRELYGHPDISLWQMLDLAATGTVAMLLMWRLARSPRCQIAILVAGTAGVYEGVMLAPTLTRGFVLAAVPAGVERVAAAGALATGVGTLITLVFLDDIRHAVAVASTSRPAGAAPLGDVPDPKAAPI